MTGACIRSLRRVLAGLGAVMTAAALLGLFGAVVPTVHADPNDDRFLAALQSRGITYRSPEAAIAAGHEVCAELGNGLTKAQVAQNVMDLSDLDPYHAGYFVGASVGAYCSQYAET